MSITPYRPDPPDGYGFTVDEEDFETNGLRARLSPRDPGGCWAAYMYDVGPVLLSVHPVEIDALRAALEYGIGGHVVWLPWGMDLTEAEAAAKATAP
jgi:hypothetical protein